MSNVIGIRELKNRASSIVRRVREEATEYVITLHGQPAAVLRPIRAEDQEDLQIRESLEALQQLFTLGMAIAGGSPEAQSAVDLLAEMREEENQWPS
jgi:prevent-host-death family protein